ncbi:MAG: galactose-1-phosphate uridylyltransferase [Patescibacteria group bacterium]|nr:galactose-1-phosphate uridylyltransferase [Patescibacteria group bacterium]MBU1877119.1 galactose-1-phosphate uridylyltransferase [Patescibacteria group bacterium]
MSNSKIKNKKFPAELRMDLASGDWIIVAPGRSKVRKNLKKSSRKKIIVSLKDCPFCNIKTQKKPTLIFSHGKKISLEGDIPDNWTTIVIPNLYPTIFSGNSLNERIEGGLYKRINAIGFHELVITRNHNKSLAQLSLKSIKEVFDTYQDRYLFLAKQKFVNYISIFHNHGFEAGASQPHPHSQIMTTPLIDADLRNALSNSWKYYKKHKKCLYCEMSKWEKKTKKRIVFENKDFLVICPFASKFKFQIIISPKKHSSSFEKINEEEKWSLAEAFQQALTKLYKTLGDPSYNFYLHTAPCDNKNHNYYHWHWTIIPKTSILGGFETGTRMEVSAIEPEKAAEILRKQK